MNDIINKIIKGELPSLGELTALIDRFRESSNSDEIFEAVRAPAETLRDRIYGRRVFLRGLVEISSYCKNDCHYCGIRRSNKNCERYRLTPEQIIECCDYGASIGFHTFVLQGGEDPWFTDDRVCEIVRTIKKFHPDCAVTLSLGERSFESYKLLKEAGADRYLLRHETADADHYASLHPKDMSFDERRQCLKNLKALGFQTGAGFMVGSPGQTSQNLAKDLLFIADLKPHMVGIGPFIPHKDTPYRDEAAGTLQMTLFMLSLTRLILPNVLLPSTTALGTIAPDGRERGVLAGANVVMPNLSPVDVRKKYLLYNDKLCSGDETAEHIKELAKRFDSINCSLDMSRGDAICQ